MFFKQICQTFSGNITYEMEKCDRRNIEEMINWLIKNRLICRCEIDGDRLHSHCTEGSQPGLYTKFTA